MLRWWRRPGMAAFAVGLLCLLAAAAGASPARADAPNTVTVYVQPLNACASGRMNVMWCDGTLGAPFAVSADPAASPPLWANTGYAVCWTSASGATLPAGASCSPSGSATASGHDFSLSTVDMFPLTLADAGGSGCVPHINNAGNSYYLFVRSQGTCTLTIDSPAAPGFSGTTAVLPLRVVAAPGPAINGRITASSGRARVGRTAPLQSVTCNYENQFSVSGPCPGVILTWTVLSGRRSCRIIANANVDSEALGTVSVRFARPGRCTVRGSYPASPGAWEAYSTPTYAFTVTPGRGD